MAGVLRQTPTVWALAFISDESEQKLRTFFAQTCGIKPRLIVRDMHATVYHARRPMPSLVCGVEPITFSVPGSELRMMAMAPGGENPRSDINPLARSIGLRIRRLNGAAEPLLNLRRRMLEHETQAVLGRRSPSTDRASAFGARHYQPHITALRPGAVADPDLSKLGKLVRQHIGSIQFDRLVVRFTPSQS